jgi:hypothetical protein
VRERWSIGKSRAYQLIGSAEAVDAVSTVVDVCPSNEAQVRPLFKLPETQVALAWKTAVERAPEVDGQKRVTGALVNAVVREMQRTSQRNAAESEPEWLSTDEATLKLGKFVCELMDNVPDGDQPLVAAALRSLAEEIENGIYAQGGRRENPPEAFDGPTVASLIEDGFSIIDELATELEEVLENIPDNLRETAVNQGKQEAADSLRNCEQPKVPNAAKAIAVKYERAKKLTSRMKRLTEATSMIQAAADAARDQADLNELVGDLDNTLADLKCVDIPGMYA